VLTPSSPLLASEADAVQPNFSLDPNRRPINPTAPNRLKPGELLERQAQTIPQGAKPGEALEHVVGPSLDSLGQATSDMAGGLGQAAGGLLGATGEALGGVLGGATDALGQTARDVSSAAAQVPEALQAINERPGIETLGDVVSAVPGAASAVGEAAAPVGEAASALGTAVSNVPLPENRSAQDVLDQAQTQPPASETIPQALNTAQQNLSDEYTQILQDPGKYAHDLTQSPTVQAAMPQGAGPLLGMTPGLADTIGWVAQNGFDADHVNQALDDMSHPDPAKRPASAKVAAGGVLNPLEGAQFITEALDAHTDLRRSIAEAVQSPEIRDTPEGKAAAEGVALVTDPQNLAMLADPALIGGKAGKVILDGTEKVATRLTGEAAEAAAKGAAKHAPEYVDFVRPLTRQETETVLQRAALDLNDQVLDDSVKIAREMGDRYEPLTGDQARRAVMNAVARTNPGIDAEAMLIKTDDIMRGAG
jgi:hypothetical protein